MLRVHFLCLNLSILSLLSCTFSLRLSLWPIQRCGSQAQLDCQSAAAAYISALQLSQGRIIPPANHRSTPSIHPIHLSVKQIRTPSPPSPPVPPSPSPHHHHLHLLLSKQLPPQKNWDPFNSPTSTFTHKHLPSLERGKHTKRYIVCVCACVHTSMNTCTNRGKGQHWTNKWFMLCNYTQRTQCTPMTL